MKLVPMIASAVMLISSVAGISAMAAGPVVPSKTPVSNKIAKINKTHKLRFGLKKNNMKAGQTAKTKLR